MYIKFQFAQGKILVMNGIGSLGLDTELNNRKNIWLIIQFLDSRERWETTKLVVELNETITVHSC